MSKPKQYDGNVYEIDEDAVSVLVLSRDDIAELIGQEDADSMTTAQIATIARRMTDSLLGDQWTEALETACELSGLMLREAEND